MKEYFNEVRCDFLDDEGFWTVDAWRSADPDAEGEVVAVISDTTGGVYYCNVDARLSPMAKEAIDAKVAEIKARERKVYAVARERHAASGYEAVTVEGIFDAKEKASARVKEVYDEDEKMFREYYSQGLHGLSCQEELGELHYGDEDYDDIYIRVTEFVINKSVHESVLS